MSVLETLSSLPIASPLKMDAEQGAVRVEELIGYTLLHIRGNEAEAELAQSCMKIGDVVALDDGLLARLRRDEFLLLMTSDAGRVWLDALANYARVTVTDITHGRCALLLTGDESEGVLRKVCALDFSDAAFPMWHAAQTSLAKVRTLIIRADFRIREGYALIVDRSLAQYVWDVVYDAAQHSSASTGKA